VHCALSALAPVSLEVVRDATRVAQWDALVARWHPLGFQGAFGYRLRYFITAVLQNSPRELLGRGIRSLGAIFVAREVAVAERLT
jgi:1-acyl-sn-glycerol-3-phosphate acyltransferase